MYRITTMTLGLSSGERDRRGMDVVHQFLFTLCEWVSIALQGLGNVSILLVLVRHIRMCKSCPLGSSAFLPQQRCSSVRG